MRGRITEHRGPGYSDERSAAAVREERDRAAGGEEARRRTRGRHRNPGKGKEAGPVCERSGTKEHRKPGGADEVQRRRTLRAVTMNRIHHANTSQFSLKKGIISAERAGVFTEKN